jgi:2-C-methyl-D-erythritol 4-phosphate cytidylyltransferase
MGKRSKQAIKVVALLPSAGPGKRIGKGVKKPFLSIGDRPILAETIERVHAVGHITEIIPILQESDMELCLEKIVERYRFHKIKRIAPGGHERQDSVYNGLKFVDPRTDLVLIHDGVRPFVTSDLIEEVITSALEEDGAVVGVPVKETIKEVGHDGFVKRTPPRNYLWSIQTPQVFHYRIIFEAYETAYRDNFYSTDDASLVERIGGNVKVIMGSHDNIKITTPEDLILGEIILKRQKERGYADQPEIHLGKVKNF